MHDLFQILWVLVPAAVLAAAARHDVATREVPDSCWVILCAAGIPLSVASRGPGAPEIMVAAGSVALAAWMLSGRLTGRRAVPFLALATAMFAAASIIYGDASAVSVPAVFLLVYAMYLAGLIPGGADAKCLMSLALAFPVYPETGWTPLLWDIQPPESLFLTLPVSVLVLALAVSMLWGVRIFLANARDGRWGPRMFSSHRMPAAETSDAHVWVLGEHSDGTAEVTPMIPFVLPLAVSYVAVVTLGSPLALI